MSFTIREKIYDKPDIPQCGLVKNICRLGFAVAQPNKALIDNVGFRYYELRLPNFF